MATRRGAIATIVAAVVPVIAGCERGTRLRTATIKRLQVVRTGNRYTVTGKVSVRSQGPNEDWRTFHNVTVEGYDEEGEQMCVKEFGNMDGTTPDVEFSIACDRLPNRIVVAADESPCDADTVLHEYLYVGQDDDGKRLWEQQDRECDS